jgi:hypothetical protein
MDDQILYSMQRDIAAIAVTQKGIQTQLDEAVRQGAQQQQQVDKLFQAYRDARDGFNGHYIRHDDFMDLCKRVKHIEEFLAPVVHTKKWVVKILVGAVGLALTGWLVTNITQLVTFFRAYFLIRKG